ncbi:MAG TPA: hypothetical protein VJ891_08610, partial [Casimicrobiaceae bacterium]|nr:hypothetical protein [Casimicrobiaceae bacterium]
MDNNSTDSPVSIPTARIDWKHASDTDLVDGLLRRDAGAWREFDQRYRWKIRARVRCVASCMPAALRDVDEIVGEVMCWLLTDDCALLRNFNPARATLEGYLLVIARSK